MRIYLNTLVSIKVLDLKGPLNQQIPCVISSSTSTEVRRDMSIGNEVDLTHLYAANVHRFSECDGQAQCHWSAGPHGNPCFVLGFKISMTSGQREIGSQGFL